MPLGIFIWVLTNITSIGTEVYFFGAFGIILSCITESLSALYTEYIENICLFTIYNLGQFETNFIRTVPRRDAGEAKNCLLSRGTRLNGIFIFFVICLRKKYILYLSLIFYDKKVGYNLQRYTSKKKYVLNSSSLHSANMLYYIYWIYANQVRLGMWEIWNTCSFRVLIYWF